MGHLPYHRSLMPQDTFSSRIAFVDYDGARALDLYQQSKPGTREECSQSVRSAAPRMVNGVGMIRRFVEELDG